ncbi:hypothetical protein PFISCL1PPCAC_24501, partial [Pristionchus fissidentatus]
GKRPRSDHGGKRQLRFRGGALRPLSPHIDTDNVNSGQFQLPPLPPPPRRLPIPRRSPTKNCRMLNPLVDGKSHPDNDGSCVQGESILA